jgi:magnesium transporter
MVNPILLPDLRLMLSEQDKVGLAEFVNELHPATAADFSEGLSVEETWQVLAHAQIPRQAEIFEFYPLNKQIEMAQGAGRERMSRLIEAMSPDDRVDLLEQLDDAVVDSLLPLVAQAERQDIRLLLSYPEHSAGAVMTSEYASLPADITVGEALSRLRKQAPDSETIYYVYVLDGQRHLLGLVSLRQLILARPTAVVGDLMERELIQVHVEADQEEVAQILARYDFLAVPVVDSENRLVGIVTHDDVIDVVVDEATEDVHRLGGVEPLAESYLVSPFFTLWRKRVFWLALLFVAELFTVSALKRYELAFEKLPALVLFIPLIISCGGNSGSQSTTLITRALALGEIRPGDWWRIVSREVLMGLCLGIALGLVGFGRAMLVSSADTASIDLSRLAAVVALGVTVVVLLGNVLGASLPLLFKRLGLDPAIMSNAFVASLVDVTGIVAYFTIATVMLP